MMYSVDCVELDDDRWESVGRVHTLEQAGDLMYENMDMIANGRVFVIGIEWRTESQGEVIAGLSAPSACDEVLGEVESNF
jgi:hypothetical protein